jgi:cell division protein FtsL
MMFRNKDQNSLKKQLGSQETPKKPIQAAKRRIQLHPFFFHIGPVALCICSVLLIGLMAVLYLSQLNQAVTPNQQIQEYQRQQATLQHEDQDLLYSIAYEESPGYIADHAKSLGLVPADSKAVIMVIVPHLLPIKIGHSN